MVTPPKPARTLGFGAPTGTDAPLAQAAAARPAMSAGQLSPDCRRLLEELASRLQSLAVDCTSPSSSPAEAFALGASLALGLSMSTPARRKTALQTLLVWVVVAAALVVVGCCALLLAAASNPGETLYYS